ncbi:HK97 gp10 family phage protein [Paenibacillus sp. FSL M7-1455]|uniref:HK97 gp10 family phage protein n=1 Tax=Paenibacillus sp. FSL M7-1455 TaxID=2975316 RepID=UPI0030FC0B44
MEISLDIDFDRFISALEDSVDAVMDGAKTGMHDALDRWQSDAVNVAPLDKGTLRRSIKQEPISIKNGEIVGEISANAIEMSKSGRFNYAYYIHEENAGGRKLRRPGTVKKFLEVPLRRNQGKYADMVEKQIVAALKRRGLT